MPTANYSRSGYGTWSRDFPSWGWVWQENGGPYHGGINNGSLEKSWIGHNDYDVATVANATVSSATLDFTNSWYSTWSYPDSFGSHPVYASGAGLGGGPSASDYITSHTTNSYPSTNVTSIAQKWISGTHGSNGVVHWYCHGPTESYGVEHRGSVDGANLAITYTVNTPPTQPGAFTEPDAGVTYNASIAVAWGASTDAEQSQGSLTYDLDYWNGSAWVDVTTTGAGVVTYNHNTSALPAGNFYKYRVRAYDGTAYGSFRESGVFTIQHNTAPNPATPTTPINNLVIDRGAVNRFQWTNNDPDAGDTQSKYDIRYRTIGAGAWTTLLNNVSTNPWHDFAALTFAAGDYEWQVLPYDSQGVVATAWSASGYYTAANAPATPVFTDPLNGGTVAQANKTAYWNAADQDDYQIRRVADNAGVPDTSTVYYDSGTVQSIIRNAPLIFETNNRWEHVQVRVRDNALWSAWASVRVNVSYSPPPEPTLFVMAEPAEGRLTVTITNPAPVAPEPALSYNDLFRRVVGTATWERIATALVANATHYDYTAVSGISYEYMVQAFGVNETSTLGDPTVAPVLVLRGSWLHVASDPNNTIVWFRYNDSGGSETWIPEVVLSHYAGRALPVAEWGEAEDETGAATIMLDGRDEVDAMRELARLKTILCYRDGSGRKVFGIIPSLAIDTRHFGGVTAVSVQAVDYVEAV